MALVEEVVGHSFNNKRPAPSDFELPKEKTSAQSTTKSSAKSKPLSEDELKLQRIVDRRREQRRKLNRRFSERTGHAITLIAFDRVKRIQSENDELDGNLENMLQTVRDLQAKFVSKLEKREHDIAAGVVDAEEPKGKERARQMTQWLAAVPALLEQYDEKKQDWAASDRALNHLTTVFNYIDQGNNSGAPGAVPPTPRTDLAELSDESDSSDDESEGEYSDASNGDDELSDDGSEEDFSGEGSSDESEASEDE